MYWGYSQTYCTPSFANPSQLYISRVRLNTLDHSQTFVSTSNSYSNRTAFSTTLASGTSYTITINSVKAETWYAPGYGIWIDYNNDGDFLDANEQVGTISTTTVSPVNLTFTVPGGVTPGNKRLRINMVNWYTPVSCAVDGGNFGETEDYTVNITASATPTAVNDNLSILTNSAAGVANRINVATNDAIGTANGSDGNDYSISSTPLITAKGGSVTEITDGVFQYVPAAEFIGTDSFIYTLCDAGNVCRTATVFVTVNYGACIPTSTSQGSHFINRVVLTGETQNIDNTSGNNGGYANFTDITAADLKIGSTYPLTITGNPSLNTSTHRSGWTAFIDFNKNGVFDATEIVYDTNGEETTYPFLTRNITIPNSASTGTTVMRIGTRRYWSANNPCGNGGQPEEFEDYTVNILPNISALQNINLLGNTTVITKGATTTETTNFTNFGIQDINSDAKYRTFTIKNTGYADLTLGAIPVSFVTGSSATFSILNQPIANTTIASGQTVTFTIAFDPSTVNDYFATISVASNDPDDNPFTFLIQGEGAQIYLDTDGDGISDNKDVDDDNDGILDTVEQNGCLANTLASVVETQFLFEDFGSGINRVRINESIPGVTTTYCFEDGTTARAHDECDNSPNLGDGKYTVHYSISDGIAPSTVSNTGPDLAAWSDYAWTTTKDHTPGDTNGRMAVFNAAEEPGVFYETQITGILPGVPITYSFWALNIDNPNANFSAGELPRNLPNITVNFYSTDYSTLLASFNTGNINRCSSGTTCLQSEWQEYLTTAVLSENEFIIQFVNNAPGGNGNDLAIDDIRITQTLCDTDSDGIADIFDLDNDNDGIPNIIEAAMIPNPDPDQDATTKGISWIDANGNGLHDLFEGRTPNDFDGDGVPNYLDLDSDNDTIFDVLEFDGRGDLDINGNGVGNGNDINTGINNDKFDGDGILGLADTNDDDADANDFGTNGYLGAIDSDGDGMPDYLDVYNNITGVFDINTGLHGHLDTNNDGIIDDTSDAENDGIMDSFDTDNTRYGSPRDLNQKYSLFFDGRNDYIEESGDIILGQSNTSIMAWVKLDPSFNNHGIVLGQDKFYLQITNTKSLRAVLNDVSYNVSGAENILPTNIWAHVAAVLDGSNNTLKLYINGALKATLSVGTSVNSSANKLFRIGSLPTVTNGNYFKGEIEEVRVFNTALTADQLQKMVYQELDNSNFSKGAILPANIENLNASNVIRYYKMDTYKDDILDNIVTPTIDLVTGAKLYNIKNIYRQTAPLPYIATTSGNWTNASVWEHGTVWDISTLPNKAWSIVKIKANSIIETSADQENLGLIIENTGKLIMNNDVQLKNNWYLKLDGTIDLQGMSQLIQTENSLLDATSSGHIERDQQGQTSIYNYNYWSSPVGQINSTLNNKNYTVNDVMKDGSYSKTRDINWIDGYDGEISTETQAVSLARFWLYKFENNADSYANWISISEADELRAGQGYTLKGSGTTNNFTFIGKPNNGIIDTNTITDGNLLLVGNPYPSALDASKFINDNISSIDRFQDTGIDGTLYFWEHAPDNPNHILSNYLGGYGILNLSGGVSPIAPSEVSGIGMSSRIPKQYIPVGQGFFVYGKTGIIGNVPVIFNNSQRAFVKETESTSFSLFKTRSNPKTATINNNVAQNSYKKIRLGFNTSNGYHRQILLAFMDDKASSGFDLGYDGEIIDNFPNDMFFLNNKKQLAIQGEGYFQLNSNYPIGIKTNTTGKISFNIDTLENFDSETGIYIYDNQTKTYHDIRNKPFEINLSPTPTISVNKRFSLYFSNKTLGIEDKNKSNETLQIRHILSGNLLEINNQFENIEIQTVTLFSISGKLIATWKMENPTLQNIQIPLKNVSTGVYIVKIKTSKSSISKKIIIN